MKIKSPPAMDTWTVAQHYNSYHLVVDVQGILFFDRMTMDVLESIRDELKVSKMLF